jgi:hypothetical protein
MSRSSRGKAVGAVGSLFDPRNMTFSSDKRSLAGGSSAHMARGPSRIESRSVSNGERPGDESIQTLPK